MPATPCPEMPRDVQTLLILILQLKRQRYRGSVEIHFSDGLINLNKIRKQEFVRFEQKEDRG